eukprot:24856_1
MCVRSRVGASTRVRLTHRMQVAYIGMSVYVCVSTCDTPLMSLIFARNLSSGANLAFSHSPKEVTSSAVTTLKSRQPPHTTRCTLLTPLTPLTSLMIAESSF